MPTASVVPISSSAPPAAELHPTIPALETAPLEVEFSYSSSDAQKNGEDSHTIPLGHFFQVLWIRKGV